MFAKSVEVEHELGTLFIREHSTKPTKRIFGKGRPEASGAGLVWHPYLLILELPTANQGRPLNDWVGA